MAGSTAGSCRSAERTADAPAFLMPLLIREVVPTLRRRIADAVAAIRTDKPGRFLEQVVRGVAARPDPHGSSNHNTDLATLDDYELDMTPAERFALVRQGNDIHLLLHGALMPILAELAPHARSCSVGQIRKPSNCWVACRPPPQPAHHLAQLARLAADRPAVSSLLRTVDRRTASQLADADPEFAQAFDVYQRGVRLPGAQLRARRALPGGDARANLAAAR